MWNHGTQRSSDRERALWTPLSKTSALRLPTIEGAGVLDAGPESGR